MMTDQLTRKTGNRTPLSLGHEGCIKPQRLRDQTKILFLGRGLQVVTGDLKTLKGWLFRGWGIL